MTVKGRRSGESARSAVTPSAATHTDSANYSFQDILHESFSGTMEPQAAGFFEAVIRYMTAELIEHSANVARENTAEGLPVTIKVNDVIRAVTTDPELKEVFKDTNAIQSNVQEEENA